MLTSEQPELNKKTTFFAKKKNPQQLFFKNILTTSVEINIENGLNQILRIFVCYLNIQIIKNIGIYWNISE